MLSYTRNCYITHRNIMILYHKIRQKSTANVDEIKASHICHLYIFMHSSGNLIHDKHMILKFNHVFGDATFPSIKTILLLQILASSSSRVAMITVFLSRFNVINKSMIFSAESESRPSVGSSANISCGFPTTARAIETLCSCSPDNCAGLSFRFPQVRPSAEFLLRIVSVLFC